MVEDDQLCNQPGEAGLGSRSNERKGLQNDGVVRCVVALILLCIANLDCTLGACGSCWR